MRSRSCYFTNEGANDTVRFAKWFVPGVAIAAAGIVGLVGVWFNHLDSKQVLKEPHPSYYVGAWQRYVSAFVDDPVVIQVPLYLNAQANPDTFFKGIVAPVGDSQHIDNVSINKVEQLGTYVHYTIQLTCHYEKPGMYNLDHSYLLLDTAEGQKKLSLGHCNIDIVPKSANLASVETESVSGGTQGIDLPPEYEYFFTIRNAGKEPITFERLALRTQYLQLKNPAYSFDGKQYRRMNAPVEIAPGAKFYFHVSLAHPKNDSEFVEFQPQLKFEANGKQYTVSVYNPAWYTLILDESNVAAHAQPLN
jgi:hypothetical protein